MDARLLHPALHKLITLQSRGKLRRVARRCRSRRRAILTAVAVGLATIWMAQAAVAIVLRPAADPAKFLAVAPLCMAAICVLKTVKLLMIREHSGVRFRPAEVLLLETAPFPHRHIRGYKVAGHAVSIVFTALCASFFLCPDVPLWLGALAGAWATMMFAYLSYMVLAVVVEHLSPAGYRRFQVIATLMLVVIGFLCLAVGPINPHHPSRWTGLAQLDNCVDGAVALSQTAAGTVALAPFWVFTRTMTAETIPTLCLWGGMGAAINLLTLVLLLELEQRLALYSQRREQRSYALLRERGDGAAAALDERPDRRCSLPQLPWIGGAGPIAWRQLVTAWHHRTGAAVVLVLFTASLCGLLLNWFDGHADDPIKIVFVLLVLTNLVLPAVLTFDFRRDVDRFAALKLLPIAPRSIVLGQLLTPVALSSVCQLTVMVVIACVHPHLIVPLAVGCLFLIPANVVIYGLENYIFLLYPYRITEYDLQASTRRVVMLFAKLLILFGAMLSALATALLAVTIANATSAWSGSDYLAGHLKGTLIVSWWWITVAAAGMLVRLLCGAFRRFDLNADQPV